jgi:putative FmdB family regulatory protein
MPLYEYECDACQHKFEVIQKFSDAPLEKCPKCGGAVHKLQSAPAFQFKGSGWYITDYAKKPQEGADKPGTSSREGVTGEKKDSESAPKDAAAKPDKPAEKATPSTEPATKST